MQKLNKLAAILALVLLCGHMTKAQSCDTTKYEEAINNGWAAVSYYAPTQFGPTYPSGYITGSNDTTGGSGYTLKANYFDISATSYTYIHGVIVKFLKANCKTAANLSKLVYFKVFADSSGQPASTVLGVVQKTMTEIKADVEAGGNTLINFPSPIVMPSSKKFYVAVDVSNLVWLTGGTNNDSLSIAATNDDQVLPATAWEYSYGDSEWTQFSEDWSNPNQASNDLNINLWIFPYVSTSSTGCGLLPVNLLSFNATRNNNDVNLKWEVSNEINMKGYSIEKANNNGYYQGIIFIPASKNLKNQTYTSTDRNAFATSSTVQYRIKQVEADGSIKYSRIVTINHSAALTDVVFQNPFSGALKLQLTLAATQKISVQLYDLQGRMITAQPPVLYTQGSNTIIVNNTSSVKPGTYLVKLNVSGEQMVYKVVKQ